METIAQKKRESQEELELENKDVEEYLEHIDPEEFWEKLGKMIRQGIRITLEKTISREFSQFIGALDYERSQKRKDVRNGYRSRDFGTIYGLIEDIQIPRARNSSFTTWILPLLQKKVRKNWPAHLPNIPSRLKHPGYQKNQQAHLWTKL